MKTQLWTGVLALLAVSYGCTCSGGTSEVSFTPSSSVFGITEQDCRSTPGHIPFFSDLALPPSLPDGLELVEACLSVQDNGSVELTYENAERDMNLHVATVTGPPRVPVMSQNRSRTELQGGTVAYIADSARPDGTRLWGIEFEKDARAYFVLAVLGPNNVLTVTDLKTIADAMASRD